MSVKASAETLRSIPLFADCDAVHLQVLAFSAPRQQFAEGSAMMSQGQAGEAGYLILNGTVALARSDGRGEIDMGEAGPGAFLGETAMIAGRDYTLTARAITSVEAVRIGRDLFMRVAQEYPEFAARVHRALARRLEASLSDLADAKLMFDRAKSFSNL